MGRPWIIIASLFLAALPMSGAEASQKVILALGDSITAGAPDYRSPSEAPPHGRGNPQSQYAFWLEKQFPNIKVLNRGISGQTTADLLARLDREIEQAKPNAIILMAGVNDIFRGYSIDTLKTNLQSMYEKIQARGIPLMVLTILPYRGLSVERAEQLNQVNAWIQTYALSRQLGYCDAFEAMRTRDTPPSLEKTRDGLHPNAEGYRDLAQAIAADFKTWGFYQELAL